MKIKSSLLPLILALLSCLNLGAQTGWKKVNPPFTQNFNGVSVAINTRAYAAGDNGRIGYSNGGYNWFSQTSPVTSNLKSVDAITLQKVFICGDSGVVLKTINAGVLWTICNTSTTINFKSIDFITDSIGFVVGDSGKIYKTLNAGFSWTQQISGTTENLLNVVFPTINTGYASGNNGILLKTTNSGNTWSILSAPVSLFINDLSFTDSILGFACGQNGTILKTINGGTNWSVLNSTTTADLLTISFSSPLNGFALGDSCWALRTIDGGNTWLLMPGNNGKINACAYFTSTTALAVGDSSKVLVSHNNDWGSYNTLSTATEVADLFFSDSLTGVAVGGNHINNTFDGLHWNTYTAASNIQFVSVNFPEKQTGYTCSRNGLIYKSIDSGQTWLQINTITTSQGSCIYFLNRDTGFFCDGSIYKTVNGGQNWNLLYSIVSDPINKIQHTSGDTIFGINSNGFYRSTDQCATWKQSFISSTESFTDFHFPNPNTGYVVGMFKIYKTIDAGENWIPVQYNYGNGVLFDIYFTSRDTGYAVGRTNSSNVPRVIRTNDGGVTWLTQTLNITVGEIQCVFFPDARHGYVGNNTNIANDISILTTRNMDPTIPYYENTVTKTYYRTNPPDWIWARSEVDLGSYLISYCYAVNHKNGNSASVGSYSGTSGVTLGSTVLNCGIVNEFYLGIYDSSGVTIGSTNICAVNAFSTYSLAFNVNGKILLGGNYDGNCTIGNISLPSALLGNRNAYLACIDSSGTVLWVKTFTSPGTATVYSISCDHSGNIFVSVGGGYSIYFNPTDSVLSSPSSSVNIFIAKFSSSGNYIWGTAATNNYTANSLSLDQNGNPYITGTFLTSINIGNQTLNAYNGMLNQTDIYLGKFDGGSGTFRWAKSFGGPKNDFSTAITADSSGRIFFGGVIRNGARFDNDWVSATMDEDLFIACYDTLGTKQWVATQGGQGREEVQSLCTGPDNNIYFGGHIDNQTTFDDTTFLCGQYAEFVIGCLNSNGELLWIKNSGPEVGPLGDPIDFALTQGIGVDDDTNIYSAGRYMSFGHINNTMVYDAYVAKIGYPNHPTSTGNNQSAVEEKNNFKIYPNPATNHITIEYPNANQLEKWNCTIYDLSGRICAENTMSNTMQFDISGLAPGVYFIIAAGTNGEYQSRFVKD